MPIEKERRQHSISTILICCAAIFFFAASDGAAGEIWDASNDIPVLRILYCAESKGELFPCPTCGGSAAGGLARRASLLDRLRGEGPDSLFIIGPHEFWPDNAPDEAAIAAYAYAPDKVLAAYLLTRPDLVYISNPSAKWLTAKQGMLPPSFVPVKENGFSQTIRIADRKVGVVLFPEMSWKDPGSKERATRASLKLGQALQGKADLVIGVSPWGQAAEEEFLPQAQGVFHVILGSGGGLGFPVVQRRAAPGVLWVRPDMLGRTVNCLELLLWPDDQMIWIEDVNFRARQSILGPNVQSDAAVDKLLPPGAGK